MKTSARDLAMRHVWRYVEARKSAENLLNNGAMTDDLHHLTVEALKESLLVKTGALYLDPREVNKLVAEAEQKEGLLHDPIVE